MDSSGLSPPKIIFSIKRCCREGPAGMHTRVHDRKSCLQGWGWIPSVATKQLRDGGTLTLKGLKLALTGADMQELDLRLTAGMLKKINSKREKLECLGVRCMLGLSPTHFRYVPFSISKR